MLSQKLQREIPHFCMYLQRSFYAGEMSLQTYFCFQLQICNAGLIGSICQPMHAFGLGGLLLGIHTLAHPVHI